MTSTVHVGQAILNQITQAQAAASVHIMSWATGRCVTCGEPTPCLTALSAQVFLSRYRILPRRVPGASRPESAGAAHTARSRWSRCR